MAGRCIDLSVSLNQQLVYQAVEQFAPWRRVHTGIEANLLKQITGLLAQVVGLIPIQAYIANLSARPLQY
jgi:hypothetical protein